MKPVFLTLATTIFFIFLFWTTTKTLTPWNLEEVEKAKIQFSLETAEQFDAFVEDSIQLGLITQLLNLNNIVIWLALLGAGVISGFMSVHLFIDKMFFKRFFEPPDLWLAARRGVIIYLAMVALVILRLIAALFWYNALSVVLLAFLIELGITSFLKNRNADQPSETAVPRERSSEKEKITKNTGFLSSLRK
jgi:Ca2+/Na+ antiporter